MCPSRVRLSPDLKTSPAMLSSTPGHRSGPTRRLCKARSLYQPFAIGMETQEIETENQRLLLEHLFGRSFRSSFFGSLLGSCFLGRSFPGSHSVFQRFLISSLLGGKLFCTNLPDGSQLERRELLLERVVSAVRTCGVSRQQFEHRVVSHVRADRCPTNGSVPGGWDLKCDCSEFTVLI